MSENAQELIDKMIAGEIPPPPIAQLLGIKLLKCRDGMSTLTINLQINFIRSVVEAELIAEARTIHRGRSVGFLECTIKDTNGNLIATATSTCKVFKQSKK